MCDCVFERERVRESVRIVVVNVSAKSVWLFFESEENIKRSV